MSSVATLVTTIAVAAGGVALYRYAKARAASLKKAIDRKRSEDGAVIDYERDPESGVFKPKR